jgi:hypothetical protein
MKGKNGEMWQNFVQRVGKEKRSPLANNVLKSGEAEATFKECFVLDA